MEAFSNRQAMAARGMFVLLMALLILPACSLEPSLGELKQKAEQGDAGAQYNLGLMCYNGEGVPQDDTEAVRWFRAAAEQGFANAQYNLGLMYANGQGVPEDDEEAVRCSGGGRAGLCKRPVQPGGDVQKRTRRTPGR